MVIKQIALSQTGSTVQINLNDLKDGVYYYRVFIDNFSSDLQQLQVVH